MYLGGPPNATKKIAPLGCLQKILELTGKLALVVDDHLRCLASHEIGGLVQIPIFSRRFITIVQIHKVARDIAKQHKIYITKTSTRLELLKFHLRSGFLDPATELVWGLWRWWCFTREQTLPTIAATQGWDQMWASHGHQCQLGIENATTFSLDDRKQHRYEHKWIRASLVEFKS